MFCIYCGKELPEGAAFCTGCGTKIDTSTEPVPQPQPEPAPQPEPVYQPQQVQQPAPQPQAATPAAVVTPAAAVQQDATNPAKNSRVWPAVCGVMGILALVFHLIAYITPNLIDHSYYGGVQPVMIAIFILMAVGFFVHTREIPWITIIPFLIYIIYELYQGYYIFEYLPSYLNWMYLIQVLFMLLPLILFIFYVLITLIRPHSAALRVLYMVFFSFEIFALLASLASGLIQTAGIVGVGYIWFIIVLRMSMLFFHIGYAVAAIAVRPRRK